MTRERAEALLLVLRAAFVRPEWDEATKALYISELTQLDDAEAADAAVRLLVRTVRFRPTIAEILTEYKTLARRNSEARADAHGLPLPDISEADRRRNLKQLATLRKRLEKGLEI